MQITKREEVTKQGFCKILWRKLHPRESLLLDYYLFTQVGGVGVSAYRIWVRLGEGGGGCLFEAGHLLTFSAFRMGVNSRLGAYSNKYGTKIVLHGNSTSKLSATSATTEIRKWGKQKLWMYNTLFRRFLCSRCSNYIVKLSNHYLNLQDHLFEIMMIWS